MIQKVKEKLHDNPTWFGVTVGLTIILVVSLAGGWFFAEQAAENAFGKYVTKMESILDRMERLSITQTQNVNVGRDREADINKNARDILAKKGLIDDGN